jgi:hypothetical protein
MNLSLRAERRLSRHFKTFGQVSYDRAFSNEPSDEYEATVVMGGVSFEL